MSDGMPSSKLKIVQIQVDSHFDLVSWLLALEATELVSEPVTQMAVELNNNYLQYSKRDKCKSFIFFM